LRRRSRPAAIVAIGALALASCGRTPAPSVEDPTKTRSEVRALYVREAEAPAAVKAGGAVEVLVRGDLPNPGWKFLRWEIRETEGGARRTWIVTPLIVNTLGPGEMVAQVVVPFEGVARFDAPAAPGRIAVDVRGFAPEETLRREVEVVPASTFLVMTVSGGFAGISDRVAVTEDGSITASRSLDGASAAGRLTTDEMAALQAARDAAGLPSLKPHYLYIFAADLFLYEIIDLAGTKPIQVIAHELAMPASLASLVHLLKEKADALLGPTGPR